MKMNWVTFGVIVAMIVGLVFAVRAGMKPEQITALAAAALAISAQLEKLIAPTTSTTTPPKDDGPPPPPPNLGGPAAVLLVLVLARGTIACATLAAQKAEAEADYSGELAKCASTEASRQAVDKCKADVRQRWNVQDAQAAAADGAK